MRGWHIQPSKFSYTPTSQQTTTLQLRYDLADSPTGLPMEDIVGAVGSILDLILDVGLSLDSGTRNSSSSLLDAYNDFIQSDLVAGQQPVNVLNRLFSIQTQPLLLPLPM
jgi:hypothetical protein